MMDNIRLAAAKFFKMMARYIPDVEFTDVLEIIIIAFVVYQILIWIKNSKAWFLLKGIIVILAFMLFALLFEMDTILWIAQNALGIAVLAVIVVFQPELRRALEELGRKRFITAVLPFDNNKSDEGVITDKTVSEVVKACFEMAKVKTGALIVFQNKLSLNEYTRTGIDVDAIVSSQLLINIFEHNTPLHDGAVIIRGNRIVAATCYLPLSDNMRLSKELGTRHRAAVGMSEVSDALVISVSEETGRVSFAIGGHLTRAVPKEQLREKLVQFQNKPDDTKKFTLKKGKHKDERKMEE